MAKIKLSEKKLEELKAVCKSFNNEKGELINVLHKAQGIFGYLPAEVQEVISKELNVSVAHVYGIVTFYSFFTI
jgi:NADH-quinone oxidoreductase subunit E/NADP-reducing hydrogenase subunit HndA